MASYSLPRTAMSSSLEELMEIFRWIRAHEKDESGPVTVLIGGWAVYSYNPWYGSVDIDLVTNSRSRQNLMWYLRNERGFVFQRDVMVPTTVAKNVPEGKIIIISVHVRIFAGLREEMNSAHSRFLTAVLRCGR